MYSVVAEHYTGECRVLVRLLWWPSNLYTAHRYIHLGKWWFFGLCRFQGWHCCVRTLPGHQCPFLADMLQRRTSSAHWFVAYGKYCFTTRSPPGGCIVKKERDGKPNCNEFEPKNKIEKNFFIWANFNDYKPIKRIPKTKNRRRKLNGVAKPLVFFLPLFFEHSFAVFVVEWKTRATKFGGSCFIFSYL
jgi:hypothetical protein